MGVQPARASSTSLAFVACAQRCAHCAYATLTSGGTRSASARGRWCTRRARRSRGAPARTACNRCCMHRVVGGGGERRMAGRGGTQWSGEGNAGGASVGQGPLLAVRRMPLAHSMPLGIPPLIIKQGRQPSPSSSMSTSQSGPSKPRGQAGEGGYTAASPATPGGQANVAAAVCRSCTVWLNAKMRS